MLASHRLFHIPAFLVLPLMCLLATVCLPRGAAQETISPGAGAGMHQQQEPAPVTREAPDTQSDSQSSGEMPGSNYDPALFQKRIPQERLVFLTQFAGKTSNELYRDKQFRNLMKEFVPDCLYHYGSDKFMGDALDEVIKGSTEPVQVREGRYVMLSGHIDRHLLGQGFLWIDTQEGIGIGVFYFNPTNGEPTPVANVFSRQVKKELLLEYSELPAAFVQDFAAWERAERLPALTTHYFITGSNSKILLEHDEDFCTPIAGIQYRHCDEMYGAAVDKDMEAASYLEQTHHVTNATARMIDDPGQVAWIGVRERTCGGVIDPLGCHVRMTRERTRIILHAPPPQHHPPARPPVAHPVHK
jgi:hypothetical protein